MLRLRDLLVEAARSRAQLNEQVVDVLPERVEERREFERSGRDAAFERMPLCNRERWHNILNIYSYKYFFHFNQNNSVQFGELRE